MTSDTKNVAKRSAPAKEPLTRGHRGELAIEAVAGTLAGATTKSASVYQVAVLTGDMQGAGTDGDVWLWVDGTARRSGWRFIDNANDNFERGMTDYFYLNLPDLGALVAAWLYFRPLGDIAEWFLNTVVVNGKTFAYYNWIRQEGMYRLTAA